MNWYKRYKISQIKPRKLKKEKKQNTESDAPK